MGGLGAIARHFDALGTQDSQVQPNGRGPRTAIECKENRTSGRIPHIAALVADVENRGPRLAVILLKLDFRDGDLVGNFFPRDLDRGFVNQGHRCFLCRRLGFGAFRRLGRFSGLGCFGGLFAVRRSKHGQTETKREG